MSGSHPRTIISSLSMAILLFGAAIPATAQTAPADPLKPGDVLRMRIFQEPEMSGEFAVDERGMVTLPRLGAIQLSQWPADSIRARLIRGFAEYLRAPAIDVMLLRRVSVTGSVMKPGLYPVDPTMTVSDALALAGGAAPDGSRDKIELRRESQRLMANLSHTSTIGDLRLRSGDQLYVPQRSWLSRNTWLVSTLLGASATITTILITR